MRGDREVECIRDIISTIGIVLTPYDRLLCGIEQFTRNTEHGVAYLASGRSRMNRGVEGHVVETVTPVHRSCLVFTYVEQDTPSSDIREAVSDV